MNERAMPIGAETGPEGTRLRVWAPRRRQVAFVAESGPDAGRATDLRTEAGGYFSGLVAAPAGTRYRLLLDGADGPFPDPASRFQPEGPHGPSEVVDPAAFAWTDQDWRGLRMDGQVIYELHVGTFTPEGSWATAARLLPVLRELGVTAVEVMPVADFPGRFGWGYDGVSMFAPTRLYGRPDDARRFVDAAHGHGIGVILDVVYNHIGPDGNYLGQFTGSFFTDRYQCEWGEAINYDGPGSDGVREFVVANAAYWIREYHMDGLRLDATQQIFDASPRHVLAEIGAACRAAAGAQGRSVIVVNENEPQHARLVRPESRGGFGLDALWNDDFHHAAMVALTGHWEAYYHDFRGTPQEFVSAARHGFLYQGQRYAWQKQRRGAPATDLPPPSIVTFLQNHDQVANSARGSRIHHLAAAGSLRAMTALLLLMPGTPMLFQGQEFAASAPFLFFADHEPDLARLVAKGRAEFLAQFPSIAAGGRDALADPADPDTFARCKLDHAERGRGIHAETFALHRDLLRLRREEAALRVTMPRAVDGAVLGPEAFLLRFPGHGVPRGEDADGADCLLVVNLGRDLDLTVAPEPLLAPPEGMRWRMLWSSEAPRYGGNGARHPEAGDIWRLPGHAAVLLRAAAEPDEGTGPDPTP